METGRTAARSGAGEGGIGAIPGSGFADEIAKLSGGRLAQPVTVSINRRVFDYDQIIICGPVFPREVGGFSGGNKYFFPGIAGPVWLDAPARQLLSVMPEMYADLRTAGKGWHTLRM
jgi:hypothetical protein